MSEYANEFERYSAERKESVLRGETPSWYTTQGYLMFKRKYAYENESIHAAFVRIAETLAVHLPSDDPEFNDMFTRFFNLLWSGKLSPSTPVMCNTGTPRGHTVSCAGGYVEDSVDSFYMNNHENAMLSKNGYGTSSYLGAISPRGTKIKSGGETAGVVPVFDMALRTAQNVSQGSNRRGQWAGYLEVDHGDFGELCEYILQNPSEANVGWIFTDKFISRLKSGDPEAVSRWNELMYIRARTGKGYFWKPDTANRLAPEALKATGISIKASNLCSEIALPQDKDHTFSCVLSSLNLAMVDEITDQDIKDSIYFLDCVVSEMLLKAKDKPGMERIVRFTEKSRALGLGVLGFHTMLQKKMIPFESLAAKFENRRIFRRIRKMADMATQKLAMTLGEPEWCTGFGIRNSTLLAIAPTMSSSILCGSVSQGIEPIVANAFNQKTSAGEMTRMNPTLVDLLKSKGCYSEELMKNLAKNHEGSVQHLDILTDEEKEVFKTAYEIDQYWILKLAEDRQDFIDQGQSLNFFFPEDETYIADVHKQVLLSPVLKGAYYMRSLRGVKASTGECFACQ